MQKVEMYYSMSEAERYMREHIKAGWRVHTCTMGCVMSFEKVLVVYENNT